MRATPTIRFVEAGPNGGVYQHTMTVAELLATDGRRVVLYTAANAEPMPSSFEVRGLLDWRRGAGPGAWRKVRVVLSFALRFWPAVVRDVTPGDVVHLEGVWCITVARCWLAVARRRGAVIVVSPHNTFARSGSGFVLSGIKGACRGADAVVVYSDADRQVVEGWGVRHVEVSPLSHWHPEVTAMAVDRWRAGWLVGPYQRVVVVAGQIRIDKGLPEIIAAMARARDLGANDLRLAVVGEDRGGLTLARAEAARAGVEVAWTVGFQPLEEFVSAIAAADALVAAHAVASQSGAVRVARQLGVPTLVPERGGLPDEGDLVYPPGDLEALAAALADVAPQEGPPRSEGVLDAERCLAAHYAAYGMVD